MTKILIQSVDANRDNDQKLAASIWERPARLYVDREAQQVSIMFDLGKEEDDTISITFDLTDFFSKLAAAIIDDC